jgi:hypothetical protein
MSTPNNDNNKAPTHRHLNFELVEYTTRKVEDEDVVFYTIRVSTENYAWNIRKRFRQIYELYKSLPKVNRQCIRLDRPILSKRNDKDLTHRMSQIRSVLGHIGELAHDKYVLMFVTVDIFIDNLCDFEGIVQHLLARKEIEMKNEIHKETVAKMLSDTKIVNYRNTISEMENFIKGIVAHNKALTDNIHELTGRIHDIENSYLVQRREHCAMTAECTELRNIIKSEKEASRDIHEKYNALHEECYSAKVELIAVKEERERLKRKLELYDQSTVRYASVQRTHYTMSPYDTSTSYIHNMNEPSAPPMTF